METVITKENPRRMSSNKGRDCESMSRKTCCLGTAIKAGSKDRCERGSCQRGSIEVFKMGVTKLAGKQAANMVVKEGTRQNAKEGTKQIAKHGAKQAASQASKTLLKSVGPVGIFADLVQAGCEFAGSACILLSHHLSHASSFSSSFSSSAYILLSHLLIYLSLIHI